MTALKSTMLARPLAVAAVLALLIGCNRTPPAAAPSTASHDEPAATTHVASSLPEKLESKHLPNPVRVHEKVISGGLPAGAAAFRELRDMGIKTVISVDGAKPDVELARSFGLRYVHLPHGYDGISLERSEGLAKAVHDLPGPIYIHCHHGKHRSPAAAAVACVGAGLIPASEALAVLTIAGTSPNYRGLFQSAEQAARIDEQKLTAMKADFPEQAKLPALAEAMVAMEHTHDHVKALAANSWQPIADQPALDVAHEALLLREHYQELLRMDEVAKRPEAFRELVQTGLVSAEQLEKVIAERTAPAELNAALTRVNTNCTTCHQQFRDVPLNERATR